MTLLKPTRRGFLFGALAAPAIVHAANLMPIFSRPWQRWWELNGQIITVKTGKGAFLPPRGLIGEEITIINHGVEPLMVHGECLETVVLQNSFVMFVNSGRRWEALPPWS